MLRKVGLLCGLILLVVASSLAMGGSSARAKQSTDNLEYVEANVLEMLANEGEADFILRFTQTADLSAAEEMDWVSRGEYVYQTLQAEAIEVQGQAITYLEGRGIEYRSFFASSSLYVYAGDLRALRVLVNLPQVSQVRAARVYNLAGVISEELRSVSTPLELFGSGAQVSVHQNIPEEMSWAVSDTQADDFWITFGTAGEGIVVANIDTGVQWDHPGLIESYRCQDNPGDLACWYDPTGECAGEPCDPLGHGTGTMGPMTGENELTVPYQVGMAPEAQWIACKACTGGGSCSDANLLACADWIMAPNGDPANRPHLVNNAWGGGAGLCNSWFDVAISSWLAAGIAPTFAAGGSGPGCSTIASPADHVGVFTATAHDSSRVLSSFSPRGPSTCPGGDVIAKPNMVAPGVNVRLPVPTDDWQIYSGTSFSNAYSSGALALLMSCSPSLVGNPAALFEALQAAADTPPDGICGAPPSGGGNFTYGHGYINMLTAGELYCGATGWLEGVVSDQDSGSPLEGAVITATLTSDPLVQLITYTDAGGNYTMTLLVDAYDLEAAYPGYEIGIASVEILTDTLTIQDFALIPESIAMGGIDGTVTDQRTGIALQEAVVTATLVSDPLTWITTTTDETGYYTMTLEVGQYDLLVTYEDYEPGTATVDVQVDTVTHQDFILWDGVWYTDLPLIVKN